MCGRIEHSRADVLLEENGTQQFRNSALQRSKSITAFRVGLCKRDRLLQACRSYQQEKQAQHPCPLPNLRAMATNLIDRYRLPYATRIVARTPPPPTELPFSVLMPRQLRPGDRAILEVRFIARVCGREGASAAYTVLHGVAADSDACASAIVVVKSGAPVEIVGCRLLAFEEYAVSVAQSAPIREGMTTASAATLSRMQRFRPLWPPYTDAESGMHAAAMVVLRNFPYTALPWIQPAPHGLVTSVRSVQDFANGSTLVRLVDIPSSPIASRNKRAA